MRARFLSLLALLLWLTSLPAARADSGPSTGYNLRCETAQADVYIDGEKVGQTPLGGAKALTAGEHTVRVTRPGYTPFIDVFRVKTGSVTPLEVELVPISGVLRITTEGKSGHVYVDEKYVGDAPVETEMSVGNHNVRIVWPGYSPETFAITAVAGQVVERPVALKELPADQNPYAVKAAPPPKWYQKWWVWAAAAGGVAIIATAIIVPVVLSQHDVCDGLDRCVQTVGPKSALTVQGPSYVAPQGAGLQIRF